MPAFVNLLSIIIILLLLWVIWHLWNTNYNINKVKSSEGKYYEVLPSEDEVLAANKLSMININIAKLVGYLKKKYPHYETNQSIIMMITNYNPDTIREHRPSVVETNVAFTVNKGEEVRICLRNKNGVLHDDNTIMFVALHELSHMSTDAIDHPRKFWVVFKWILQNAMEAGIIKPIDYSITPQEYCTESKITYSPLFDENLF
jgi:hypothetical protein